MPGGRFSSTRSHTIYHVNDTIWGDLGRFGAIWGDLGRTLLLKNSMGVHLMPSAWYSSCSACHQGRVRSQGMGTKNMRRNEVIGLKGGEEKRWCKRSRTLSVSSMKIC